MNTAEILPDNINKITTDGDVVPRDDLNSDDFETRYDELVEAPRPPDTRPDIVEKPERSALFPDVVRLINAGIEESIRGGYATMKVRIDGRQKPLVQFMANDIYKFGLTTDEVNELLRAYVPEAEPKQVAPEPLRRTIGRHAAENAQAERIFDPHELRSGLHKDLDS